MNEIVSRSAHRIVGFDLARGTAIFGMVAVHFGLVMAADPSRPPALAALMRILDGRAAATFVILAGVGLTLRSHRARGAHDQSAIAQERRTLRARGVFLLALGFLNLTIWPGDILRVYGVSLLIAAWLIDASDRRLLAMTAAFPLGFLVLIGVVDYEKNWEWATMTYHRLWTVEGAARNLFYDGFRSVFPWTGLLIYGMRLGRLDLRDSRVNRLTILWGLGVALAAEAASAVLVSFVSARPAGMDAETIKALFGTESMPPLPLFLLAAGGTATMVIALCVRIGDAFPSSRIVNALAATGRMALTWYFVHIVFGLGAVVALGLQGRCSLGAAMGSGVGFFAAAVLISALWRRQFRHGPLEWIMRKTAG